VCSLSETTSSAWETMTTCCQRLPVGTGHVRTAGNSWGLGSWGSPVSRTESATSHIQRIPTPSPPKAAPKLKYSHMVESTLRPCDPGKPSPDLSHVRSHDVLPTLGSHDIQARDPGKVSHDLPRDWSSTRSQVTTRSHDHMRFRHAPSPLISTWKTVGTINKSTSQQTSHKTLEYSKVAYPLPVFVPALKYGLPI